MAKETTYYWNQRGVYNHRDSKGAVKPVHFGEKLPDGIDKKTLDSMLKKKRITTSAPRGAAPAAPDARVVDLTAKLEAADDQVIDLKAKLAAADDQVIDLKAKLAAAEETIAQLTQQLTEPAPKAGPK